jgi:serine/threonine protein kinase
MAIESLTLNKISKKSDIWSYAVLLWEIYSHGCSPYPSVPPENILKYIQSGNRLEKPLDCDVSIYNLMLQCWSLNENDRPHFDYILTQLEAHLSDLIWTSDSNLMTDSMTSTDKKIIKTSSSTYPDSNSTEYTMASNSCRHIPEDIELEPFIDNYYNVTDAKKL